MPSGFSNLLLSKGENGPRRGDMSQLAVVLHSSREDILLVPSTQGQAGTAALYIYSGEVSCNFSSQSGTDSTDQLIILIEPGITSTSQIVGGLNVNPPIPIVAPTSWNANDAFSVIAINSPELLLVTESAPPIVPGGVPGLYIAAQVTVQNGMLLNAQYQVSVRAT
jgi:hypothetical protein